MSESTSPMLSEKTPIRITVRKLVALLVATVTLTSGAVGYHLKTLSDIHDSLKDLTTQIQANHAETVKERSWMMKTTWSVIDQTRWATKLKDLNEAISRQDGRMGMSIPDPYEIHPIANVPAPTALP